MAIIQLDKETIEQIAAGEVIESPVSIIKELVENSLDAGSKNIVVEIKNGGKSYIRVTDDGIGIDENEIELAFKRHTTSKIKDFKDLYDLFTLGFRGEALSSIIACANLNMVSKTKEETIGKKVEYSNNKIVKKSSLATNTGTSIEITNLFKNLPVRRRFLKSDITESNKITKLMYQLSLGYNDVSFKYIKDDKIEFQTSGGNDLKNLIGDLIDDNLRDNLLEISSDDDTYKVFGYISNSNYYRGNRSLQYLYVNGRLVENADITKAIERNYSSILPNSRYPAFFIFINTNAKNIDVNVHPSKKEIKFVYKSELIELITNICQDSLYENLTAKNLSVKEEKKEELNFYSDYEEVLNSYNKVVKEDNTDSYKKEKDYFSNKEDGVDSSALQNENLSKKELYFSPVVNEEEKYLEHRNDGDEKFKFEDLVYKCSLFNKFSIYQYRNKAILLNHRRADEKIKFESFVEKFKSKDFDSQILLEPIILTLSLNQMEDYLNKEEDFRNLGFDIQSFGEKKIIIRSIPLIFESPENLSIFYDFIDLDFSENEQIFYNKISNIISKMSFRKGDNINKSEADYLMKNLLKFNNPYKTFKGKNTIIIIAQEEVEKFFER